MSSQPQQSLRKHRQTLVSGIAPGKSKYGSLVPDNGVLPSVGAREKEKVGNLVKKRFSSRAAVDNYAGGFEEVPALPNNASEIINEATGNTSVAGPNAPSRRPTNEEKIEDYSTDQIDVKLLRRPDFNASAYIAEHLSSATPEEISKFADELAALSDVIGGERKAAVYNVYTTFLRVGNDISRLSEVVDKIRLQLTDLNSLYSAVCDDAEELRKQASLERSSTMKASGILAPNTEASSAFSGRSSNNRSSILMLENIWASELASLFKHVEGAQKFLPAIPGRHIVKESGGWYELNSATLSPLQPVHFFLLNDHLLVATKKRHRPGDKGISGGTYRRLIADKCWYLSNVDAEEITRDSTLILCIKDGHGVHLYNIEKKESHRALMDTFKKTKEENKLEAKNVAAAGSRLSERRNRDSIMGSPAVGDAEKATNGSSDSVEDRLESVQGIKEMDYILSEIDTRIAYNKFSEAVDMIITRLTLLQEESKRPKGVSISRSPSMNALTGGGKTRQTQLFITRLGERKQRVCDLLLRRLSESYISKGDIENIINILISLNKKEAAKHEFLTARRAHLHRRVKTVTFQGDIINYLSQIAIIYFRTIYSTAILFSSSFRDSSIWSSLVEWAKEEVDSYSLIFARQLYKVDPSTETYQKCVEITKVESSKLKELGLNFDFALNYIYEVGSYNS